MNEDLNWIYHLQQYPKNAWKEEIENENEYSAEFDRRFNDLGRILYFDVEVDWFHLSYKLVLDYIVAYLLPKQRFITKINHYEVVIRFWRNRWWTFEL